MLSVREIAIGGTGHVGILGQIAANLKAGVSAALAPAVDPRRTYMSAERKQQALLAQVRVAMNHLTASKQRMQARAVEDRARLPYMLDEARADLAAGRSDLARVSLRRPHVVALELEALETQLRDMEHDETNLRVLERRLANQVDEFVARQQVVIARYNAAEAQVQIKEAVTGVSLEFAELAAALAQAEEKTEGMEARVSAIDRLVREGLLDPGPLESHDSAPIDDVEDQLSALERELS